MRRIAILGLLCAALSGPALAQNTQAQYLNQNNSQSPTAVVLCPSATVDGVSANCEFVSGGPNTQAQYLNQNGSTSPAMVLVCPDPSDPGYTIACDFSGGGGGSPGGAAGDIQDNNGAGGFGAAALNDNGTIIKSTESIDTKTNATVWEIANESGTGTTANKLAFLTGAPSTAKIQPTASQVGALGIVIGGAGTTGSAQIAITGQASCVFDAATTAGHYVVSSTGTAGDCHDAGASEPNGVTVVGIVLSTNASAGTFGVSLFPPTENSISGSSGTASKPCTSTANSIQYGLSSTSIPTFACAPAIVNSGVWDFTGTSWQMGGIQYFWVPNTTDLVVGSGAAANYNAGTNATITCVGYLACQEIVAPTGPIDAFGGLTCGWGGGASSTMGKDVCLGWGSGAFLSDGTGDNPGSVRNTLVGVQAMSNEYGTDTTAVGFQSCGGNTGVKELLSFSVCLGSLSGSQLAPDNNTYDLLLGYNSGTSGTPLTGGAGNIVIQSGENPNCGASGASVSNEFDFCGNGTDVTPFIKGNLTSLAAGNLKFNVPDASPGFTVSALPASPPQGSRAYVTDAVACTFLAAPTGGGSAFCPLIYSGSAWVGG